MCCLLHLETEGLFFFSEWGKKTTTLCAEGYIINECWETEELYINTLSLQLKEGAEHSVQRQKKSGVIDFFRIFKNTCTCMEPDLTWITSIVNSE